jgi:hypothetical protein
MRAVRATAVTAAAAALVAASTQPAARADDFQFFQSPSGNIACQLGTFDDHGAKRATAACEIGQHSYSPPPRPDNCHGGWGDSVGLVEGRAATLQCHTDTLRGSPQPVLDYGQTRASGHISCTSERYGMRCADANTDHAFLLSEESYEIT